VKEKRSDGKTSAKIFTVTFEVTGIEEIKKEHTESSGDLSIDTNKPGEGPDPGKIDNNTIHDPKISSKVKELKELAAPTWRRGTVSRSGLLEIEFSEPLIVPKNITMINSTSLEIKVTAINQDL